jgi:hypothetical protein
MYSYLRVGLVCLILQLLRLRPFLPRRRGLLHPPLLLHIGRLHHGLQVRRHPRVAPLPRHRNRRPAELVLHAHAPPPLQQHPRGVLAASEVKRGLAEPVGGADACPCAQQQEAHGPVAAVGREVERRVRTQHRPLRRAHGC